MLTCHVVEQWMNRKLDHSSEVCERLSLRIVPASKQVCISMYMLVCMPVRAISRMRSCMHVFKDVCACPFPCLSLQTVECSRVTSVLLISSHHHMQASIAKQSAALKKAPTEVPESRGLLRVTVIEAQNLPKMDLMRTSGMTRPHLCSWTHRLMPLAHTVN
jgi:hypothetical protein